MASLISTIKNLAIIEMARGISFFSRKRCDKKIWIISETQNQYQDSGYELYQWLKKNKPDIDAYYVLDKNNRTNAVFLNDEKMLWHETLKLTYYLFIADRILSTHGLWMIPNGLGIQKKCLIEKFKHKGVMLHHGIMYLKNCEQFYHKDKFSLTGLMIATSQREKNLYIDQYGYDNKEIVVTGLPRHDSLVNESNNSPWPNLIVFMPTFRENEQNIGENFKTTEMFNRISTLVNDNEIKKLFVENNIHLAIYLHQNIQNQSEYLFELESEHVHVVKQGDYGVKELLVYGKILITDYSSTIFDFAYMSKACILYPFDFETYLPSRSSKSIKDIRQDIPADVVVEHSELVGAIKKLVFSDYKVTTDKINKIKHFFEHNDLNNCERVYEEILKMKI
ncbi:MAG: CDP-glycerol glycerophosphotransferase family protein [Motiliproteus sp.]